MKTFSHLWQYLAKFFLKWEMLQTKVVEKIRTHVLRSVTFSENRAVREIMPKNMVEPERPQMRHKMSHTSCVLDKQGFTCSHMHTHTRSHRPVCNTAFPRQDWVRGHVSVLRYTYITSLFCTLPRSRTASEMPASVQYCSGGIRHIRYPPCGSVIFLTHTNRNGKHDTFIWLTLVTVVVYNY